MPMLGGYDTIVEVADSAPEPVGGPITTLVPPPPAARRQQH